ncbi:13988_t:CDS:2 [Acaulospora morrowiae]|uniref:13988_t:CDS:1 n=1 Tax=Acaulospora morrowiae TaxID=94023 RepID=A0A9N9E8R2_9GLOM|nr:13988_t:CDS:2 [Acaulospora morrowiae]
MVKILKCSGCDQEIRTDKTRDLNKHMNLNENLRKGQCQPALRLMQNPVPPAQLREENVSAVDPGIESTTKQNKTILIYKNIANADNNETSIKAYIRISDESEAISKKTKAPRKSEKISEQEKAWIDLASTGALIFAEKYEGEAIQYDFHTIDVSLVEKWTKFPYGIYKATIEGNPSKKSLQCTRYLRYNPHGIYTHYDLESAKRNGLKVYLINESPNVLIYERNVRITGKDMFGKWGNILYNIKKEGGTAGKVSKALLVSLWGALCEQRNGQNYGAYSRIKPFLLVSARKKISEIVRPLGDQVKCIHTDGFIVAGQVNLKTGIEMGELKFEKRGVCIIKNCISVTWKPPYPEILNLITNSLPDFEKIQDKEQNTKLDTEYPASQTYQGKKELLTSVEDLYNLYYELSKKERPMTETEIEEAVKDVLLDK